MHPLESGLDNVQHHIVLDVKLVNHLKIVTIRSAFIVENRNLLSIYLISLDLLVKNSEIKILMTMVSPSTLIRVSILLHNATAFIVLTQEDN
ncbi:unnamed protein product [Rhizopus stolonifer]